MNKAFSTLYPTTQKRNLFTYAVQELGSRIVRGDVKPGDTLPNEADLGRELGASRTVVREAVKSLASKGLIDPRTRVGTKVLPSTQWNLLDLDVLGWRYASMPPMQFFRELSEIRRMIEPEAAALAAERVTPDDLAVMSKAYDDMVAAEPSSNEAIDADIRFHRSILQAAHNALILQMGGLLGVGLLVSFGISSRSFDTFLPQHKQVLDAIASRDPKLARATMDHLLAATYRYLERELAGALEKNKKPA
jgi:GntR family transcriptional regulator, galactonate operon transcriptional repressor